MSLGLAIVLVSTSVSSGPPVGGATPVTVIAVDTITRADQRAMAKRERQRMRLCRRAVHSRDRIERLTDDRHVDREMLSEVAYRLGRADGGLCPHDSGLAISILERLIGPDPLRAADTGMVGELARQLAQRDREGDAARATELKRLLWVRGDYYRIEDPQWRAEELRAFVARDDVWMFLSSPPKSGPTWRHRQLLIDALTDPLSPRRDAARAVTLMEAGGDSREWTRAAGLLLGGDVLPADSGRAEALLVRAERFDDAARALLLPILTPRLASGDPALRDPALALVTDWAAGGTANGATSRMALLPYVVERLALADGEERRRAVTMLTQFAVAKTPGADVPLLRWADGALRRGDATEKAAGWQSLGMLATADVAGADQVMAAAFVREGGLLDGGKIKRQQLASHPFIVGDDYPARSIRAAIEGVVEADVIIMPNGRVLRFIVTGTADPTLAAEVGKLAVRRLRFAKFPQFAGRYVRASLPPVQFRLVACADNSAAPIIEGAIVVDGTCRRDVLSDNPVS